MTKVLVTGGAGFIGSALVRELIAQGHSVVVYDDLCLGRERHLSGVPCLLVKGSILNNELFGRTLDYYDIEQVYHLAARPFIPEGFMTPERMIQVNTIGSLRVFLECVKRNIRTLHYSTSEVYGTAQYVPMDENHPLNPQSSYAVSKAAADRLAYILYKEKDFKVTILRQFNCYGPRETHPYIIPEVIKQMSCTDTLHLGNVTARRDFTFVEDAVKGHILLMNCDKAIGEVVNQGTNKAYKMQDLVIELARLMKVRKLTITEDTSRLRPFDVLHLQSTYEKANKLTGWKPTTDIVTGLRKTVEWYKTEGPWSWE